MRKSLKKMSSYTLTVLAKVCSKDEGKIVPKSSAAEGSPM